MSRTLVKDTPQKIEDLVEVTGWVDSRRDHGKIIFIDLRDRSGVIQAVFTPSNKDLYERATTLRDEWVVMIQGKIAERPKGMQNAEIPTGTVELQAEVLDILARSETPPFPLHGDGKDIDEELRLEFRYLDLRRQRMGQNMRKRHNLLLFIRNYLSKRDFTEIETPILTKGTPEGAREFLIPSRLHKDKFYVLPQSPQQYKQLLMVAGLEKYFQIAHCFRDEDTRGDRQPEFTQLDLEMSFVSQEEVMQINEELMIEIVHVLYPEKKIQETPFPRLSYRDAMDKYGTDSPDFREDKNDPNLLAFAWITDFPFFEKTENGGWTFTHNPFSAPKSEFTRDLLSGKDISKILASQYDIVLNGYEIGGGSIRSSDPKILESVFKTIGLDEKKISENFGHMMRAFKYGAPPHGGIAWGLDRLIAILQGEPNIREVIAFPKTGDARDPMMGSPSQATPKQLKELHIRNDEK